jgi:hypothetical protein
VIAAVNIGGIEERHAALQGGIDGARALPIIRRAPLTAAGGPQPKTDFGDYDTRFAESAFAERHEFLTGDGRCWPLGREPISFRSGLQEPNVAR